MAGNRGMVVGASVVVEVCLGSKTYATISFTDL